jgi:hypothetical protein
VACSGGSDAPESAPVGELSFALSGPPTVTSFSPTKATQGATVTISGSRFVTGMTVAFNGAPSPSVTYVSASKVKAVVPVGATSGPLTVTAPLGSATSSGPFGVLPAIVSLSVTQGFAGDTVSISGSGFSGTTQVKFGSAVASFLLVDDATIEATVPAGVTTGKVSVVKPEGTATSSVFSVLPVLSSFTPAQGAVGSTVAITGAGFGIVSGVKFGTKIASFTILSDTAIQATVPAGATTAKITVETPRGNRASATSFVVIKAPTLASFSPGSDVLPVTLTITGTNLVGTTSVRVGTFPLTLVSVTSTQILAQAPLDTPTGPITVTNAAGSATSTAAFGPIACVPGATGPGIVNRSVIIDDTDTAGDLAAVAGARCITGALRVNHASTLTDLSGLAGLVQVGGDVQIGETLPNCTVPCPSGNHSLTSLSGLESLAAVGGTFDVYESWDDVGLENLEALGALQRVGGKLFFESLFRVQNLHGLERLESVGELLVMNAPNLTTLDGVQQLHSAGGVSLYSDPMLADITALRGLTGALNGALAVGGTGLTSLAGLEGITIVYGDFNVSGNSALTDLSGLSGLTSVNGNFYLADDFALTSLAPLSALTFVNQQFTVARLGITTLHGLENVYSAGWQAVNIAGNPNLTSLAALSNIQGPTQNLTVSGSPLLNSLAGIEGPGRSPYSLMLEDLPAVSSCAGIHARGGSITRTGLTRLECLADQPRLQQLDIEDNDQLTTLDDLLSTTSLDWVVLSGNDALTNLGGLRNVVSSPTMGITLSANQVLTDLTGLEGLTELSSFQVTNSPALTSLTGLDGLTTLGYLIVTNNAALTSLAGLGSLTSVSGWFSVGDNPVLPPCALTALETQVGRPADYSANNGGVCGP